MVTHLPPRRRCVYSWGVTIPTQSLLSPADVARERLALEHRIDCCLEALDHYRGSAADDKWWCIDVILEDLRTCAAALREITRVQGAPHG